MGCDAVCEPVGDDVPDPDAPDSPKMRSRAKRYSSSRWVSDFCGRFCGVALRDFGASLGRFRICMRGGGPDAAGAMTVALGAERLLLVSSERSGP